MNKTLNLGVVHKRARRQQAKANYSWYVQQFVGPQKPKANRSKISKGSIPTLLVVQN